MGTEKSSRRLGTGVLVLGVSVGAGLMFAAAAATSDGSDLRPSGQDLRSVVRDRALLVEENRERAGLLSAQIDDLTASASPQGTLGDVGERIESFGRLAGLDPVRGPGVTVTLRDAPQDVRPDDVDPNLLVVHEQDLRTFINALWSGGAEAVTLQGQRLVSTSSIVCVGSTVVIDGVPYAPPYEIEAVGDAGGMSFSLATSPEVENYKRYASAYGLGLQIQDVPELSLPGYTGSSVLSYATAVEQQPALSGD